MAMSRATEALADLLPALREMRHHLHRHPELAFEEHGTADYVAACLEEWGYEVTRGVGGTGVVATLTQGAGHRSLGLRADMDALPIDEATGRPYASVRPGVMHACGHDGHTAMLLGAAAHLARARGFNGRLHLIFQPAEERGHDGGAQAMLIDGLFERFPCDRVYAIHNHPGAAAGRFMSRAGPLMASSHTVHIRIEGVGGHAARPHLAVDPVVATAAVVVALQTVVARQVDPMEPAVVTVGRMAAGHAANVIPDHGELSLSVRCFDVGTRRRLRQCIEAVATQVALAHGARATIEWVDGVPVVDNDADCARFALDVARELFGDAAVVDTLPPMMGSEDFAHLLQSRPGALIRLGNGSEGAGLHSPRYDFNDDNLLVGAAFWVGLARRYLA